MLSQAQLTLSNARIKSIELNRPIEMEIKEIFSRENSSHSDDSYSNLQMCLHTHSRAHEEISLEFNVWLENRRTEKKIQQTRERKNILPFSQYIKEVFHSNVLCVCVSVWIHTNE